MRGEGLTVREENVIFKDHLVDGDICPVAISCHGAVYVVHCLAVVQGYDGLVLAIGDVFTLGVRAEHGDLSLPDYCAVVCRSCKKGIEYAVELARAER